MKTITKALSVAVLVTLGLALMASAAESPKAPAPKSGPYLVKVNCGGPAFKKDFCTVQDEGLSADQPYAPGSWGHVGGKPGAMPMSRDYDGYLLGMTTFRYGAHSYTFDVPNGTYSVTLYFSESVPDYRGKRLQNVSINGIQILKDFDIFAEAGWSRVGVRKAFPNIAVTGGQIEIAFAGSPGARDLNPLVNIIVVDGRNPAAAPAPASPPSPPPYPGLRKVVSLNGIWDAQPAAEADKDKLPETWGHKLVVPGLADMAIPAMEPFWTRLLPKAGQVSPADPHPQYVFYRRTFTLGGQIPDSVILKVSKAVWGKKVWVNGKPLDKHPFNFVPGYFDIRPYVAGDGATNTVVVRVGAKHTQPKDYIQTNDGEKTVWIPGIYDDVEILLAGNSRVVHVRHAPDLSAGAVRVVARIENRARRAAEVPVTFEVRTVDDDRVEGSAVASLALPAGGQGDAEQTVSVPRARRWTPEEPHLYRLVVKTDNDSWHAKIGMRTFAFDAKTKKPMLNGQIYMLRGTNFEINRHMEDPERCGHMWDRQWVRQVIRKHKALNMNSVRYCISRPPQLWYEVADEEWFLVSDEYHWSEKATLENWTAEFSQWVREYNNHPCLIVWDAANEAGPAPRAAIEAARVLDLQNRPWDNGYGKLGPTDTDEQHPYQNHGSKRNKAVWTTENYEFMALGDQYAVPRAPVTVNEYGWIWVGRDGTPAGLAGGVYAYHVPSLDPARVREYNNVQLAQETEWLRAQRHAAVQQFAGLEYFNGATADNWCPGLDNLRFPPLFEKLMRDAMAPVGLMVGYWRRVQTKGETVTIPVYVMNDLPAPWTGEVTLKLMQGPKVVHQETRRFAEVATGYRSKQDYAVTFPDADGVDYTLIAEHTHGGTTVQSVRNLKTSRPNLALGKTATASSGAAPSNVTDGKYTSGWASDRAHGGPHWLSVDLGSPRTFEKVILRWADAPKAYQLQVSKDGVDWHEVYSMQEGRWEIKQIPLPPTSARYVRLYSTEKAKALAVHEVQVY